MVAQNDNDTKAVSPVIGVILMVAITVILAAVIGTFVLGLGEGVEENARAGFTIDQEPGQSLTIKVTDVGNLESLRLIGPDGNPTVLAEESTTLQTGLRYELSKSGFSEEEVNGEFPSLPFSLNASDYRQCRIVHGQRTVEFGGGEVPVDGSDFPCTATNNTSTPFDDLSTKGPFEYEAGAEYKIVGAISGKDGGLTVIQTVEVKRE